VFEGVEVYEAGVEEGAELGRMPTFVGCHEGRPVSSSLSSSIIRVRRLLRAFLYFFFDIVIKLSWTYVANELLSVRGCCFF
jgi:hypothetical protein